MTLRGRIVWAVAPLLMLSAGLGTAGALLIARLGQRGEAILAENYASVRAMASLSEELGNFHAALRAGRGPDEGAWKNVREQFAVERDNVTIFPEEPRLVEDLGAALGRYEAEKSDAAFGEVRRLARDILELNDGQMRRASGKAKSAAGESLVYHGVGLALALALSAWAVWRLRRAVLGPVVAVTEAAESVASGDLMLAVPEFGRDEVGRLADAFNRMAVKLRAYRQSDTEKLLRARQSAQAAIDALPDPVVVLDPGGRAEFANPAARQLFGLPDGHEPTPWRVPESLLPALEAGLGGPETLADAVTFRVGEADRYYLPHRYPIRAPDGEQLGAALVLNDVTRFRLLDRLKSDWVATVSHELKTPLTAVRLAVHVLLEEIAGPLEPKQAELLVEARDGADRLAKQIDYLLSLAKLEGGTPERLPCDPAALLALAAEAARPRAEDARITLTVDAPAGLPRVPADAAQLGRALDNLLDNALTHTPAGGSVTLAARSEGGEMMLSVSDTGVGIPAEHLPRVFEKFFRVPGRSHPGGTGLGLAIVREVAEAHGGTACCDSREGEGTTFRIALPLGVS